MQKTERISSALLLSILLLAGLFSGCASREKRVPQPSVSASVATVPMAMIPPEETLVNPVQPTNAPRLSAVEQREPPSRPASSQSRSSTTRRPTPAPKSASRDWASAVREGRVTERSSAGVSFQKHGESPRNTSLFEDSILLSKVRGKLQSIPLVRDRLTSVRVNRATVYFVFPMTTPSSILTSAVNAALSIDGVTGVRLQRN